MKRTQIALIALVQILVLFFLVMAITQHSLVWFLAAAGSVTVLALLAVWYFLQNWHHSD